MNNCIERKNTVVYNETFYERMISFFCMVIAFFENKIVDTLCRLIGGAAVAVGIFFYISAVMGGSIGAVEILIFGALLIGASAFVFRTGSVRS